MGKFGVDILKNAERWEEFSRNAREEAMNYTLDAVVPSYEKYYQSVLDNSKSRTPQTP